MVFQILALLTMQVLIHDLASWLFSFYSSVLLSQDSLLPQEIIIKVEREDAGSLAIPSQVSWPLYVEKCAWLVSSRDQVTELGGEQKVRKQKYTWMTFTKT